MLKNTMELTPPAMLEALLFASGEPLEKKRILSLLGVSGELLTKAVEALRSELSVRGLVLVETETELELRTAPRASELVKKLREQELSRDLGKAGLETLAIILYRQGATRGEVDWIRGVNSSQTVRSLMLRGLIEKTEDSTDKRRPRYKATIDALAHLGVETTQGLPRYSEFSEALTQKETVVVKEAEV